MILQALKTYLMDASPLMAPLGLWAHGCTSLQNIFYVALRAVCCVLSSLTCSSDMEFLEVLTEGLERVLLVRGGGREVITIYSWGPAYCEGLVNKQHRHPWRNIHGIFHLWFPKRMFCGEMWTFECKRSLFYSCRILGHNRVHVQYTTICAIRISSSRGRTTSIHSLPRHVWLLGCSRSEVRHLCRLCLLTCQIFILLQRFILTAHLYLFIYCLDISPVRWMKYCFRVWAQRWLAVFTKGGVNVLIQVWKVLLIKNKLFSSCGFFSHAY